MEQNFRPCFDEEKRCLRCGDLPTVQVFECGKLYIDSETCGPHFFGDRTMTDWADWNERQNSMD